MYSKYERQKDKRSYVDRKVIYAGPMYSGPAERIKPGKMVFWNEEGMPTYEASEAAAPAPASSYVEPEAAYSEPAPADVVVVAE